MSGAGAHRLTYEIAFNQFGMVARELQLIGRRITSVHLAGGAMRLTVRKSRKLKEANGR